MKQLLQNMKSGETSVKEVPVPRPGKGMALVRTAFSLVSAGTERTLVEFSEKNLIGKAASRPDLVRQVIGKAQREGVVSTIHSALNRLDQPMFPGYSSAGTIVALGSEMEGFHVGDRVACGGGNHAVHAEYEVIPKNLLVRIPDDVAFEDAAFTTLGSVAIHGFRLASAQLNETVLVIGLGLLGLMEVQIAKAAGCKVLGMDISLPKIGLAKTFGVEACSRQEVAEKASVFTRGRGFDHVLICAGSRNNDSVTLAGELCRDRGNVVAIGAVGLDIPRKIYYEKEISFIVSRSYGPGRYDAKYEEKGQDYPIGFVRWTECRNMESFVDLLSEGTVSVKSLITHRIPINAGEKAYELITGKSNEPFLGVLLEYPKGNEEPFDGSVKYRKEQIETTARFRTIEKPVVGVLGAGNYANATFLPVLQAASERCELRSIASGSGGKAVHAAEKFGFREAAAGGQSIMEDPEIDTVVLLTPHSAHTAQICQALQNGKHVYCEKPAALSFDGIKQVALTLQANASTVFTVGYNRRFAPLSEKLKSFLSASSEPLAMTYTFNAGYIPLSHWTQDMEVGGGRILGEACHALDYLIWLCGALPDRVSSVVLPDLGRYNEDNVMIQLHFTNGSIGTVNYFANGDKAYSKERIEVYSGGRVAVLDDFRRLDTWHDGAHHVAKTAQNKGHAASWSAFLDTVSGKCHEHISPREIFGGTLACLAAVESIRQQDCISIPAPEEAFKE